VKDYSLVVLTFFDHRLASFGQNKSGNSPGIANKKGTLLWDNTLNVCLLETYNLLIFIALKLFLSLFLAKIITRLVVVFSKGSTPFRDLHTIYNKEV
jgi:hypothetical protein